MKFLNYDSPLMSFLGKLTDYLLLGIVWIVFSLPVVTFGAATTAMLYTAGKTIRQGEGMLLSTFWQAFRRDFKQATVLWLLALPLLAVIGLNFILIMQGDVPKALCFVILPVIVYVLGWIHLWFGYLSKFADTNLVILKNTFRMTVGSFLWVLALLLLMAATVAVMLEILLAAAPLLVLIPGFYGGAAEWILNKAFKKYLPTEETAPAEAE